MSKMFYDFQDPRHGVEYRANPEAVMRRYPLGSNGQISGSRGSACTR